MQPVLKMSDAVSVERGFLDLKLEINTERIYTLEIEIQSKEEGSLDLSFQGKERKICIRKKCMLRAV